MLWREYMPLKSNGLRGAVGGVEFMMQRKGGGGNGGLGEESKYNLERAVVFGKESPGLSYLGLAILDLNSPKSRLMPRIRYKHPRERI
jgi:hypothetical protein